jgi:uncharacterized membrane protein YphA (DoxX/SURF4 family)
LEHNLQSLPYWPFYKRLLFRFWGVYFIIYFLLSHFDVLWMWLVKLMATLFNIKDTLETDGMGSGDGIYYYLQIPAMLLITFIISMVWNLVDTKRQSYNQAFYVVWVIVRYVLAFYMISYGVAKIYESQFPAPSLHRLVQPYGMSSPMGLAWTFMGASRGFSMFTGWVEALAGVFLLFRQTARLGALQSIVMMSVIVAMNFCYDIPVKIFSTHLLLAAVFVISPEIPRLLMFLFSGKAIPASGLYMFPLSSKWVLISWALVKPVIIIMIALMVFNMERYAGNVRNDNKHVPLYGLYTAEWVVSNNDTIPAQLTDSTRWHYLIMQYEGRATVRYMDETFEYFEIKVDTAKHTIGMTGEDDKEKMYRYKINDDELVLERNLEFDSTRIILRQYDMKKFLLTNRGFRWVNEVPFNR